MYLLRTQLLNRKGIREGTDLLFFNPLSFSSFFRVLCFPNQFFSPSFLGLPLPVFLWSSDWWDLFSERVAEEWGWTRHPSAPKSKGAQPEWRLGGRWPFTSPSLQEGPPTFQRQGPHSSGRKCQGWEDCPVHSFPFLLPPSWPAASPGILGPQIRVSGSQIPGL